MVLWLLRNRQHGLPGQWFGIWAFVLGSILLGQALSTGQEIAIIVNEKGPLTQISITEVQEIYLGEIKFAEGQRITPLHGKEGPFKDRFLSAVVKQSAKEHKLHWTKKVFQEGVSLPITKNNPRDMIIWIQEHPAAIGYVPRDIIEKEEGIRILEFLNDSKP